MITLGMYKEIFNDDTLPSIKEYINEEPYKNKAAILKHLKSAKVLAYAAGDAKDIFTDEIIPDELTFMTDGKYEWRSDVIYYVEKYNLKLSDDFEQYCLKN